MTKAEEKFPDIIYVLRERLGLEPDDDSKDNLIYQYSPKEAFNEICYWYVSWLKTSGF